MIHLLLGCRIASLRDRPLLFVLHSRPASFRQDGPGQPAHIHGKIVETTQIDVRGNRAFFQNVQDVVDLRFQQPKGTDRIERLVLDRGQPAGLCFTFFELGHFVHDVLPSARRHAFIAAPKIGAGDLEIKRGLAQGLVLGQDDLLGIVAAAGAHAGALAGRSIDAIEGSSTAATGDEAVTVLHAVVLCNR